MRTESRIGLGMLVAAEGTVCEKSNDTAVRFTPPCGAASSMVESDATEHVDKALSALEFVLLGTTASNGARREYNVGHSPEARLKEVEH